MRLSTHGGMCGDSSSSKFTLIERHTREQTEESSLQILSLVKISQVQGAKGSLFCKGINEVYEMKHNLWTLSPWNVERLNQ